MSWSLQITNGDLSYGTNGLNTATGSSKLVQDLTCCILEPMGTDELHPEFGSLIEGGIDPNGNVQPSLIGGPNDQTSATFIQAEIQRICTNHQRRQIQRNQNDLAVYGTSTLTASEILLEVSNIDLQPIETALMVGITLSVGNGQTTLSTLLTP